MGRDYPLMEPLGFLYIKMGTVRISAGWAANQAGAGHRPVTVAPGYDCTGRPAACPGWRPVLDLSSSRTAATSIRVTVTATVIQVLSHGLRVRGSSETAATGTWTWASESLARLRAAG
jgi:hypothetical protein